MSNLPKYVMMGHVALRLRGDKYYRDGGDWEVGYKEVEGRLLSTSPNADLNNVELIETNETEWREDNGQYV